MSAPLAELVWSRPVALGALALPLVLLLLARVRREPTVVATGTLAVWREVATPAAASARASRPRVPPATWFFLSALFLGALALAGPRVVAPLGPRTWTVVVDDAPGTELPVDPRDAASPTRREVALEAALAWLAERADENDRVRWLRGDGASLTLAARERPAPEWLALARPRAAAASGGDVWTRLAAQDRAGSLAITDRAPAAEAPKLAGWFASGGAAVPGPIASGADGVLTWDGVDVHLDRSGDVGGPDARRVVLDERDGELPAQLGGLCEVWSGARGLVLVRGGSDQPAALVVRGAPSDGSPGRAARDGWSARVPGALAAAAPTGAGRVWLRAEPAGRPVVTWTPGLVTVGARALTFDAADPAQVAVSFAELFDAALLAPPGVVPLEARLAAGDPSFRPPRTPARVRSESSTLTEAPLDAWLAGAAAFLGLVGLALLRV